MNYYVLLEQQVKENGDKVFLQLEKASYTYSSIRDKAAAIAAAIVLSPQVVLVEAKDFVSQLVLFLAVQAAGCVPVLLHHDLLAAEVAALLEKNGICAMITDTERVLVDSMPLPKGYGKLGFFAGEVLSLPKDEDICVGVLSSGSSGVPKLMLRSYESWAGFFLVQNEIFKVSACCKVFLQGSLSFTGNLNTALSVLFAGGTIVTSQTFRCRTWFSLLSRFSVDVIYLVPAKLKLLLPFCRERLLSVKMVFTGSQLLGEMAARKLREVFPASDILLYYGASELNYITYISYEDMLKNPQSVGRPFPGVALSVKDGYVYVDTPYHVYGAVLPFTVKDAGYLTDDGALIFAGRQQAMINRGGVKVSCLKVELAIRELEGVKDAAVLPYADEKRGSEIAAFIAVEQRLRQRELIQQIRKCLPRAEQPHRFIFLDEMPLNDRGKVDAEKLKQHLAVDV